MTAFAIILAALILAASLDKFGDKLTRIVSMFCDALKEASRSKNTP